MDARKGLSLALLFITTFMAGNIAADETDDELAKDLIGRLDLDVPDSPAFALLGVTPQNVINPDTPAELAAALLVGDDKNGNGQEGLAIEFRPFLLAMQDDITVGDYRDKNWLSRAAISFAQSDGSSDEDQTDRQAIGLTLTPIDEKDPFVWADLGKCTADAVAAADGQEGTGRQDMRDAARRLANAQNGDDETEVIAAQQAMVIARQALDEWLRNGRKKILDAENEACIKKQQEATVNGTQWQIGLGYHDSEIGDIDESGLSFWTSYSREVPRMGGSIILHARSGRDQIVARPDEAQGYDVVDQDIVAFRYRRGSDRQGVLFEASYVDESAAGGGLDDDYTTALIGAEFRIGESLWIQIGYGDTFGSNQDKDAALSGQFRWAASKSRLWQ